MDVLLYSLEFFTLDLVTAFGLFSLLYLLIRLCYTSQRLTSLDLTARKFIISIGVMYFGVWMLRTLLFYFENTGENKQQLEEFLFGEYALRFWLSPMVCLLLTQLYRIPFLSKNYIFRIFSSLAFLIPIERLYNFLLFFHRDYLPSSWSITSGLGIYPSNVILEILCKLLVFILCILLFERIRIKPIK